jgi:hypothetical protein
LDARVPVVRRDNPWHEALPQDCPPADARPPRGGAYYRAVRTLPPGEVDFVSQRALQPAREFRASECTARAISLFLEAARCYPLLKLPLYKGGRVVRLELPAGAGVVKVTSPTRGHVSWWRRAGFDPTPLAVGVKEH